MHGCGHLRGDVGFRERKVSISGGPDCYFDLIVCKFGKVNTPTPLFVLAYASFIALTVDI